MLAGGVGAARFLRGLHPLLEPKQVTVVVNTGDDEAFFGLHVSPDVDTVIYTLGGRVDKQQGWGVAHDSFTCLGALERYFPETWFQLGDADLATHIYRTDALRRGESLSRVTRTIAARNGVHAKILPMSDDSVRTVVDVEGVGPLPFQQYLIKRRARGRVRAIRFAGIRAARPAEGVLDAIARASVVLIPPSNPIVSIGPILALPGVRTALRRRRGRAAAISPIVRGRPIKGPLHHMLSGLGHEVSSVGVARLYRGLVDLFVLDQADAKLAPRIEAIGIRTMVTDTVMRTPARSRLLAHRVLGELTR